MVNMASNVLNFSSTNKTFKNQNASCSVNASFLSYIFERGAKNLGIMALGLTLIFVQQFVKKDAVEPPYNDGQSFVISGFF